jgi:hypothetical protein
MSKHGGFRYGMGVYHERPFTAWRRFAPHQHGNGPAPASAITASLTIGLHHMDPTAFLYRLLIAKPFTEVVKSTYLPRHTIVLHAVLHNLLRQPIQVVDGHLQRCTHEITKDRPLEREAFRNALC